jgi:hypothetical protein
LLANVIDTTARPVGKITAVVGYVGPMETDFPTGQSEVTGGRNAHQRPSLA